MFKAVISFKFFNYSWLNYWVWIETELQVDRCKNEMALKMNSILLKVIIYALDLNILLISNSSYCLQR